ncbi:hypothetical protein GobsT_12650 [Gemmata obscuriglobus]|nr:hypothetical protein GobsT_12650 [Gemmata obscuriglobus]VTS01862.1 unnamed protein product [Gemmata obscuriglobus UQM 2246]
MANEAEADAAVVNDMLAQMARDVAGESESGAAVAERMRRAEPARTTTPHKRQGPEPMPVASKASLPAPVPFPARTGVAIVGLPDPNKEPEVVEAQAGLTRLSEQRLALVAEITALETALGLKPGASAKDVEKLAVQLLAAGQSDADIETLERLRTRVRRLAGAEEIASKKVRDARELAVRRLSAEAAQRELVPACRAKALALLALIKCDWEERGAADRLRAGGFNPPPATFHSDLLDHWQNRIVCNLVQEGHLTREEVLVVMPYLHGI